MHKSQYFGRSFSLTTNWDLVLGDATNIESANENFLKAIVKAAEIARVPKYKDSSKTANKSITNLLADRSKLQEQIQKEQIRNKDKDAKLTRITEINKELQAKLLGINEKQEEKAIKDIKENPKAFFKYANNNKQCRTRIGPLKAGDKYVSSPKHMAQILSDQFKSVFSVPKIDTSSIKVPTYTFDYLNDINITDELFKDAVNEMKTSSAPGPDGISPLFYKDYTEQICYPFKKIWRLSLDTGKLPEGIALAIITPILLHQYLKEGLEVYQQTIAQ